MISVPVRLLLLAVLASVCLGCPADDDDATESTTKAEADAADSSEDEPDVGAPDATEAPPQLDLTERLGAGEARAGIIATSDELIGGPKADGRVGDAKLYNARVAFVVEGVRRSSGYRYWGGHVVDGDVIRPEGEAGKDLFGELFHSWNLNIFEPTAIEIVSNGEDGSAAHVRVTGKTGGFAFADSFIRDVLDPPLVELGVTFDYLLEPDANVLTYRITVQNMASSLAYVDFPMLFASNGDGIRQWLPNQGWGVIVGEVDALRIASRDVSYGFVPASGTLDPLLEYSNVLVVVEEGFLLTSEESVTREYAFTVSDGGPSGLETEMKGGSGTETLTGTVDLPKTADPGGAYVVLWDGGSPAGLSPIGPEGAFSIAAPPGAYQAVAYAEQHAQSEPVDVTVGDGAPATLSIPAAAQVTVTVKDSSGAPVSARVTLRAEGDAASPYPPSAVRVAPKGAYQWGGPGSGGKISAVGFAVGGEATVTVPVGEYTVFATRGLTWEVDETTVTATVGTTATVTLTIDKVVDTVGWVSADFHIHALRSPDSDTPYPVRIRQAITEDLDVPVLTEHVTLSTLAPTAEALGLADQLIGVAGQEVTTFEYGHFNAFPLGWDPDAPNGGGILPYDKDPIELFEAIRNQHAGDEIIQVNHPRGNGLGAYFTHVGLDPGDGSVSIPEKWSQNWDAIEVFNGRCDGGDNLDALDDWISLTNQGVPRALSSGSDAHGLRSAIGYPRNWIRADIGAVRDDHQTLVPAVRERHMFVSCGPFVRFESLDGKHGLGDRMSVDGAGEVAFRVHVQAPSWIALTEARLWRNGQVIDAVPIDEVAGGVRLDTTLTDTPTADAWYALEVIGTGSLLPVYSSGKPYALTNPIEVDADGDGAWTAPGL